MLQILFFSLFFVGIFAYLFRVPNHLKKFPRVSFFGLLKTLFTQRPLNEHYKEVLEPALKQRGYASMFWLGKWNVLISQPEIVKQLFRNTELFKKAKGDAHGLFGKFLGNGKNILQTSGSEWKRHRKPANPIFHQTFHPEMFASCVELALEAITERIDESQGEAIEICDIMEYMALDQLGVGIFNYNFDAIKSKGSSRYYYLYTSIIKQIGNPVYFLMPFLNRYPMGSMAKAHKNVVEFKQFIKGMIDKRREEMKNHKFEDSKDLLSTLLRETENNHEDPLTDEELVNNLNVFFIAGHDTTANTLSCGMYQLAKNSQVQDKLRKEIYETLQIQPGTSKVVVPTFDQVKEMEYLGLFIKEVMRINPSVAQIVRRLDEDYHIPSDNVVLPRNTVVNVSIYGIHHDPKIYPNPEKFDPERFLVGKHDTDVYMPFGGGSRMCIGSNFSLMEQKVYLIMLLQKFTIDIKTTNEDFDQLRIKGMGLTRPADLKLNFIPRI